MPDYPKVHRKLAKKGVTLTLLWTEYCLEASTADKKPYMSTDKKGCYVATAVYGSYDCPEVWTLRRFRDEFLNERRLGRLLVKIYYKISPRLILTFGSIKLINNINRKILDKIVRKLNERGYVDSKYIDQWSKKEIYE